MAMRMPSARRRWIVIVGAVVFVAALVLSALSRFYVDLLWFREVGFASVFWRLASTKALLGLLFGLLFFGLLASNLSIVRRLTPRFRAFPSEIDVIERYRSVFEQHAGRIVLLVSAVIAAFVGIAASAQWRTFLLWRSVGDVAFGTTDPVFHRDPSFYIFVLPFQKFVQGWLFSSLVAVTVLTAIAHYVSGGIRPQAVGEKVTPQVKAHLSVLLGLIVLVKAWGYYLGRFDLLVSERGIVTGASYTDIHAHKPALTVLVVIAILCSVLFLVNIRLRGWVLPGLGLVLLAVASIVIGALVPAFVQRFRVAPQAFQKERPFIERNIAATRDAFGIDVDPVTQAPAADVTSQEVDENDATVGNIRVWNPDILKRTYQALQRIQPYYEFSDVDVDRYPIGGEERMVMIAPREVSQGGVPGNRSWQSLHLIYTHGYGAAASLVNTATPAGAPSFVLQDIPPVGTDITMSPQGAQVYYGEAYGDPQSVPYVVVGTQQAELNYPNPSGGGSQTTHYTGRGGIAVGSFFRRLVFAYRYRDVNLLISGLIDDDSRILINREVRARIAKAAPFLAYDQDPYAAIVGGRLVYIQDAYTSTTLYPYSQRIDTGAATNNVLPGRTNYIRNSVKAVVDAYDGTVTFYVVDPRDPLIQVWQRAFPELFTDGREAPLELVAHFRYPENLFQIQTAQYAIYHVTDPQTFFSNDRRWDIPSGLPQRPDQAAADAYLRPYYVLLRLPGATDEQFVLLQSFTPYRRQNMVGYMAAISDPDGYGTLQTFEFPTGENVFGPEQIRNLVNQDPSVSQQITLLGQRGSDVLFGDLLVVPVGDSFVYVQPIFVVSSGTNAIPELKRVVVVRGGNASIANSLPDALAASFGRTVTPEEPGEPTEQPPATTDVSELLAQALEHFQAAQEALRNGDLAAYQREIAEAQRLVQQASQSSGGGGASPSPSASPTPTPSATP